MGYTNFKWFKTVLPEGIVVSSPKVSQRDLAESKQKTKSGPVELGVRAPSVFWGGKTKSLLKFCLFAWM